MIAVLGCGPILDQGEPGDMELLHLVDGLAGNRPRRRRQQRTHAGEHGGIDCVGLGVGTGCLGKTPCLQRVDLGQRQAGLTKASFKAMMVWAGWFKDDAGNGIAAEPGEQRPDTVRVVGKLAGVARRVKVHIKRRFGDVDANILGYDACHLFQVLCLSCGPHARVSVQATGKEKGDQSLTRPITAGDFAIRPSRRRRVHGSPAAAYLRRKTEFVIRQVISSGMEHFTIRKSQ